VKGGLGDWVKVGLGEGETWIKEENGTRGLGERGTWWFCEKGTWG